MLVKNIDKNIQEMMKARKEPYLKNLQQYILKMDRRGSFQF